MEALFEVVILPVSDADRSLQFYRDQLGFHLDVDSAPSPDFRVVQLTPRIEYVDPVRCGPDRRAPRLRPRPVSGRSRHRGLPA
jgi:catechol 2,3-dioxygenase-like lactoylglutathione lyase family enzyme